MAAPLTLADLAAAQLANPNNPYTNNWTPGAPASHRGGMLGAAPVAERIPTQAEMDAAAASPANRAMAPGLPASKGAVLGKDPGPSQMAKDAQALVANDELPAAKPYGGYAPLLAAKDSGTSLLNVPGATPVHATTGVGLSGGQTAISPERQRLAADDAVEANRKGLLDQEGGVNSQNKYLAQVGLDSAQHAMKIRDANFELDKMNEDLAKYQVDQATKERKRTLDQEAAEVRTAKVDPNHWFKERGVAGSIVAAIAMAAGAFAAAMPHTNSQQNFAMKIIDDSIGRDIDAQKDDIANKWKHLDYQSHDNDREYVRSHYVLNQMQDARYKAFDHASAMVNEMKSNTNDQIAISNLDKLGIALESKKADLDADRNQRMFTVQKYEQAQAAAAAAHNAARPTSPEQLEKRFAAIHDEWQKADPSKRGAEPLKAEFFRSAQGVDATGRPITSRDPNAPSSAVHDPKAKEAIAAGTETIMAINRLNAILDDTVYANTPKGRAEADQLKRNLTLAYPRSQTGSTRINEMELKMGQETFGDTGDWLRGDVLGTKKAAMDVIKKQTQERIRALQTGKVTIPPPDLKAEGD